MRAIPRRLIATLVLALLLLLGGGAWLYRAEEAEQRRAVEVQLQGIAQLKADQIAAWRTERLEEGAELMERALLGRRMRDWLAAPRAGDREVLLAELRTLQRYDEYADILLVDPEGRVRLTLREGSEASHPDAVRAIGQAIRERRPVFVDLHAAPGEPNPHTAVVAPLFSPERATAKGLGAAILVTDARRFLYPLLQSWPVPSRSAETLLVRREGEEVLFLNDLRHRPDTALKLRIPLAQRDVPAVMAALGREGVVAGVDYRGVPVLSVLRAVPDSPWLLVTKVDAAEALAAWGFESILLLLLLLAFVVVLGAVGLLIWQRGEKAHFRALYTAEAARRAGEARYATTLLSIGDGVIVTDAEGRVELLNPVAESLTGWPEGEARGRPLEEVFRILNEETRHPVESPAARVLREGRVVGLANHTLLVARDGTARPIADSGAPVRSETGSLSGTVLVFRDQTEERLSRRFVDTRVALIEYASAHTLEELLIRSLDLVSAFVDSPIGFYHFVEPDQVTLSLQAWSTRTLQEFCRAEGQGLHYGIDQAGVWVDCVHARGPVVHNDYASLPHKKGLPEGHAQVIRELVVPVMRGDKVVAILGVGNKPSDYTEEDVRIVSSLADVTWEIVDRKRTEQALRESEERYRQLFEAESDAIFLIENETGRLLEANSAACALYGYRREELLGMRNSDLSAEPAETQRVTRTSPVAQERVVLLPLRWHRKRDGTVFPVEIAGRFFTWQGRPVHIAAIRDITARRHAEADRERLLAAIEQAGEAILITDPAGAIQYVNPAFEAVTGYARGEVLGKNPRLLKSGQHQDGFYQELWGTIAAGQTWRGRMVNRRKDGSLYTEEATISPARDASGQIVSYVGVKRDITPQLHTEAQLLQAQKMEAVGRLAGGIAHDFNNLLMGILNYVELSREDLPPAHPTLAYLDEIQREAERSAGLTRQLLAFARRQTVAPQVLELNEAVGAGLRMLRRLIGEQVDLEWLPGAGLWRVRMDPAQLDQVLTNLLVNARDAIPGAGKVTIATENVRLDLHHCAGRPDLSPGEHVLLAVSDNGKGMDAETRSRIFEPFFTTKPTGQGSGLGLATVYGIVKQNGGGIDVYSEPGRGTTFKVYLPRCADPASAPLPVVEEELPRGRGETVLLVEDEHSVRVTCRLLLTQLGYTVLVAGTPGEALRLAREQAGPIHLLLTDVVLPEMTGRELAERLAEIVPDLRTLYMSGYTADAIAHHGVLDEGVRFLQKPFGKRALAVKVREALMGL